MKLYEATKYRDYIYRSLRLLFFPAESFLPDWLSSDAEANGTAAASLRFIKIESARGTREAKARLRNIRL